MTKRAPQVSDAHEGLTYAANADASTNIEELIAMQTSWLESKMIIVDQLNGLISQIHCCKPKSPEPDSRERNNTKSMLDDRA